VNVLRCRSARSSHALCISKPTPRAVVPDRRGEPASAQEGCTAAKKPSWARQFVSNCTSSSLQWAKPPSTPSMKEMHRIDRTMSPQQERFRTVTHQSTRSHRAGALSDEMFSIALAAIESPSCRRRLRPSPTLAWVSCTTTAWASNQRRSARARTCHGGYRNLV